jgi:hypothetical protein
VVRRLTEAYHIERLTPVVAEGDTAAWTERLTWRGATFSEAWTTSFTVEVHAVVRDGRIVYLSGPYPPIPLVRPAADPALATPQRSSAGGSVSPGAAVVGSAAGLSLVAVLLTQGPRVLRRGARLRARE